MPFWEPYADDSSAFHYSICAATSEKLLTGFLEASYPGHHRGHSFLPNPSQLPVSKRPKEHPPKAKAFPLQVYSSESRYWLVLALSRVITLCFLLIQHSKGCVLFQVSPYLSPEPRALSPLCRDLPHLAQGLVCRPWQGAGGS